YRCFLFSLMDILFQPRLFPPKLIRSTVSCHIRQNRLQGESLETVVSKRFVCLCHLVHIFFSLHRCSCVVCSIQNFVGQSFFHCLFSSVTGECCQQAKS